MKTDLYRDGMDHLERGEVEEGRRLLQAAWAEEPDSVEVIHGLARALDLAGERSGAIALLEQAHALAPSEPDAACDLAMFYLELGKDIQAEQILTPVLSAHPEHPRANLHMAMALAKIAPQRARGYAETALQATESELRQQAQSLLRVLLE